MVIHLARDLDSHVVGADSNIGGVGVSKGGSSNRVRSIGTVDNMSSTIGDRGDNRAYSRVGSNRLDSSVADNRADSRVGGNRGNNAVDSSNMADSSIGSYGKASCVDSGRFGISITLSNSMDSNRVYCRVGGNRGNNAVDSSNMADSSIGGNRGNNAV